MTRKTIKTANRQRITPLLVLVAAAAVAMLAPSTAAASGAVKVKSELRGAKGATVRGPVAKKLLKGLKAKSHGRPTAKASAIGSYSFYQPLGRCDITGTYSFTTKLVVVPAPREVYAVGVNSQRVAWGVQILNGSTVIAQRVVETRAYRNSPAVFPNSFMSWTGSGSNIAVVGTRISARSVVGWETSPGVLTLRWRYPVQLSSSTYLGGPSSTFIC
jgi:hypothetical protein